MPIANRCAIFTTTGDSMHGNPNLVAHPAGQTRKSIALYYYTATWDGTKQGKTTQFRPRSGSADKTDWAVKIDETIHDLVPPILARQVSKVRHKLKS